METMNKIHSLKVRLRGFPEVPKLPLCASLWGHKGKRATVCLCLQECTMNAKQTLTPRWVVGKG